MNFTETLEVHQSILKVLKWIDPELLKFISDLDEVQRTVNGANHIYVQPKQRK